MQYGAGDITITGATGVTIRTTSSFYAVTAGQYAIIGLKQIDNEVRWNLDGSQFIVEFNTEPNGIVTMTRDEARQLVCTPRWTSNEEL